MIRRMLLLAPVVYLVLGCQTSATSKLGWEQQTNIHLQQTNFTAAWDVLSREHSIGRKDLALFLLSDEVLYALNDSIAQLKNANDGLSWYPANNRLLLGKARALSAVERLTEAEETLQQVPASSINLQLLKLMVQLDISTQRGDNAAFQALLQDAERLRPGITLELAEQRMRQARPAPKLKTGDTDSVFSTHPSWQQRIQQIESQIRRTTDVSLD